MIFKTLGILDLLTVIILTGAAIFPQTLLLYAGLYLAVKGIVFILISNDIASYGDTFSGAYIILITAGMAIPIISTAVLIYLGQKTLLTFVKIGIETYSLYRLLNQAPERVIYNLR